MRSESVKPKRAFLAFVLSFLLPGAGLAYLGNWVGAAVNFGLAVTVPAIALLVGLKEITDHIHYVYLLIAAGSGAWAHAQAGRQNKDEE